MIFIITLIAELLLLALLSVWPPKNKLHFWTFWTLAVIAVIGFFTTGFLDWNTFLITHWSRYLSIILILFGAFIAIWAVKTIGIKSTLGLKGKLTTHGPYAYTRNPQYISSILIIIGFIIFSNSTFTIVTGFIGSIWYLIAPFEEEVWCEKHFKKAYLNYHKKVKRFIL